MSAPPVLPILYRDDLLVIVGKPSGLAVHRGLAREKTVVLQTLRDLLGRRVYPVHRLDRATSGALLLAMDAGTARRLQEQFESGGVAKRYLALVRGIPPEEGVIDHPVPRGPGGERIPAVTEFRRLATFERYALVEARPRTGRFHQIRRHFKHLSHPLIGDVRYGKGEHNRLFRERFGLHRLALHALELAFEHPGTGEPLRIVAPVPEDLAGPLGKMGMNAYFAKIPMP
ncbi:MAG TPA: pseudouridine synthase [Thermoanaerobaculia bacterium]|nr:pseudouridine synthase [Thermoanaerobaculia bacterium]